MTTNNDQNNGLFHDDQVEIPFDDTDHVAELLREKMTDAMLPGYQVEFDADEAQQVGAFEEDALSEEDAVASVDDLAR
ncbi:hypothetical protein SAMN04244573_02524 [Azotobacter beijerinckii]|uniref:Conjugal transfer protein TraD n=1 Tax=Azotobacter beijerinckii TaxID=170623 RepID=A0A1H9K064_9GAMM|nr:hypothetical protein [Azotobacter beijerinckii]SEQ92428.1 hypothetical protein SAMN04244573_02524 [Azotobacter beijerinckii]